VTYITIPFLGIAVDLTLWIGTARPCFCSAGTWVCRILTMVGGDALFDRVTRSPSNLLTNLTSVPSSVRAHPSGASTDYLPAAFVFNPFHAPASGTYPTSLMDETGSMTTAPCSAAP